MVGDNSTPTSPVDCADLLYMIKGQHQYQFALEILLHK